MTKKDVLYYTVYLKKNDEIVAFGTAEECAKMLNITLDSFYSAVTRTKKGERKKYEFYAEPLYHKIRKDKEQTMRDPNRIDKFCDELKVVWHELPDWRFGQLMCNLLGEYMAKTGKDPFFPEEPEMINFFREFVDLQPLKIDKPDKKKTPAKKADQDTEIRSVFHTDIE